MNSSDLIGEAYKRTKKAVERSLDTCKQVNNITKVNPNTAIPGARFLIWNTSMFASVGMLSLIRDIRININNGNPMQNMLMQSLLGGGNGMNMCGNSGGGGMC